jgi:predicted dehydrogenase
MLEFVAVCTAHADTARQAAHRHDVPKWYEGVDALVADPDIDLVTVAVQPRHHLALVEAALTSGKSVYCEWPLARTTAEATRMSRIAAQAGAPHAVGLQGRFAPAIELLRDSLAAGRVGEPLSFDSSLLQSPFRVDSDRSWLTQAREASGALHVATAHVTDAVQFVLGPLTSVAAMTETLIRDGVYADTGERFEWRTPDTVVYLARTRSGVPGVVSISNATMPGLGFRLRVAGSDGQIVARSSEYFQFSPIELTITRPGGSLERLTPPAHDQSGDEREPAKNVQRALDSFAGSILTGEAFSPGFHSGLELHHFIDEIAESAVTSSWREMTDESNDEVNPPRSTP